MGLQTTPGFSFSNSPKQSLSFYKNKPHAKFERSWNQACLASDPGNPFFAFVSVFSHCFPFYPLLPFLPSVLAVFTAVFCKFPSTSNFQVLCFEEIFPFFFFIFPGFAPFLVRGFFRFCVLAPFSFPFPGPPAWQPPAFQRLSPRSNGRSPPGGCRGVGRSGAVLLVWFGYF